MDGTTSKDSRDELESVSMSKGEITGLSLLGLGFLSFVGIIAWHDSKAEKERKEERRVENARREAKRRELNDWLDSERNDGRIVLHLRNGDYISIPAELYKELTFRKQDEMAAPRPPAPSSTGYNRIPPQSRS